MKTVFLAALAGVLLAGWQAAEIDPQLPSLQTTLRDPRADAGRPLRYCSLLDGRRLCAEPLADAWCRKQGFARYVSWSSIGTSSGACKDDDKFCAVVVTIT